MWRIFFDRGGRYAGSSVPGAWGCLWYLFVVLFCAMVAWLWVAWPLVVIGWNLLGWLSEAGWLLALANLFLLLGYLGNRRKSHVRRQGEGSGGRGRCA
jgi:type VI protein secretion system component VasK